MMVATTPIPVSHILSTPVERLSLEIMSWRDQPLSTRQYPLGLMYLYHESDYGSTLADIFWFVNKILPKEFLLIGMPKAICTSRTSPAFHLPFSFSSLGPLDRVCHKL